MLPDDAFERITRLARTITGAPIVVVAFADESRQWFKSSQCLGTSQGSANNSFCTHTIRQNAPVIVEDALLDGRFADHPLVTGNSAIRSCVGVPLITREGHTIGALCVMDTAARQLARDQVSLLEDLAGLVVEEVALRATATLDSLTGALSQVAFTEAATRDVARSSRHSNSLCCAIINVDHFMQINDQYGHAAADRVLCNIVAVCKAQLRESDYIGRMAGKEFAIMLPYASYEKAFDTVERLRAAIEGAMIETENGPLRVTVSCGVSLFSHAAPRLEEMLRRADAAMHLAKRRGRNCVVNMGDVTRRAADVAETRPARPAVERLVPAGPH
ncbi:GGDEF domain-containing protein [Hoeflea ulvae]|uniref:diguanylate cyclase n=1 Tax=Hoeflea ulvae TaxID=2983764 RepID=A0ABT3YJD0_9HYPH|nr:sensor domain-containing diguanylate cyclase [Hoeflea ulvae]MCY0096009.1 sensor domain-containing diguanylate cyclase [Hoeflea ulvae]